MIYVIETYDEVYFDSHISNVYETEIDIEKEYSNLLNNAAREFDITINPHHPTVMMNHINHHPHLTKEEYNKRLKKWNKFVNENNIISFIESLKIEEKSFKRIYDTRRID